MSAPDSSPLPPPPSKTKLALATLGALVLAGVVLVTIVLPAEYDMDPLGTGEALGLVVLSGEGAAPVIPVRPRRDHRPGDRVPAGPEDLRAGAR